ncbi:hypothetical protein Lser_V15G28325 [Lactuca serriola]
MVDCITGNKKPLNVPYPHWLDGDDEDEDNYDAGDEEDNDDDLEAGNKEGADEEEDTDKHEEEFVADMGEDFTQKMNSSPWLNKHIHFSTTYSSSSFVDDSVPRGSTPPIGDTTEPMIHDELFPKSSSYPQADVIPQA